MVCINHSQSIDWVLMHSLSQLWKYSRMWHSLRYILKSPNIHWLLQLVHRSHSLWRTDAISFTFLTDLWLRSGSKDTPMNRTKKKDILCLSLNFCGRYWISIFHTVHKQTWWTSKATALQPAEPRLHTSKVNVTSMKTLLKFKIK